MSKIKGKSVAVRLDNKGRISIPLSIRKHLGMEPGDTFFLETKGEQIHVVKGINPFDHLADDALEEHRAGQTRKPS